MDASDDATYIAEFLRAMAGYIPPRSSWTPADEALYGPADLFRVPPARARELQFRALRFAFERHYGGNRFYREYCRERGIAPEHVREEADLVRVPLIPDTLFREYPDGRGLALWLGNLFTGELPPIAIRGQHPGPDEVVGAFNRAGLAVAFSSGTSGRLKFIPRDRRTFQALEYAFMKAVVSMLHPHWDRGARVLLMMPDPRRTDLYAGKSCLAFFDCFDDVSVAIDRAVSAGQVQAVMGGRGLKGRVAKYIAGLGTKRTVGAIIDWLAARERGGDKIALVGPPFLLAAVMDRLEQDGRRFAFGERGMIGTGGGWKSQEGRRLAVDEFRARAERLLGVPERFCLDGYGMVESNAFLVHCPEGHFLHAPVSFFRPMVLDDRQRPLPYGEEGRYAFLDAAASSYPGFILTGDRVRMLERCPACDRTGPVLEPEVRRQAGEETRGCAEEVRRLLAAELGGRRGD